MFRNTPDHASTLQTNNNSVFGDEAWKFNADAPIRSTAVCNKDLVFFGASNGVLYALDRKNGKQIWQYKTGFAINSSPALYNGQIFFSNNKQTLYAINATTGEPAWKFDFNTSLNYEWAFDYYYSSPAITGKNLLIGGKDGFVYNINPTSGKLNWKYKTGTVVRSTPAIAGNKVFFGDVEGTVYALDVNNGKELWRFTIEGHGLKNEDFGFDRRAVIASPVVANNKVIVGGRDGFLYAIDEKTGKETWRVNHDVSWIISSVAIKDSIVVTGTSDGHFVQAVNLNTGVQLWKYKTISIVWSSPVIENNKVYIGSHDEALYCIDLITGKKLNGFQCEGVIFSSPVICDEQLFFGTDKGWLYALQPAKYYYPAAKSSLKKFVFWEAGTNLYFRYGTDQRLKEYLVNNGYTVLNSQSLVTWLSKKDSALNSVIVFASNFFPKAITDGYEHSLLRSYLDNGGKIVVMGPNPLIFQVDPATKNIERNFLLPDSVINIKYGPNDLRSYKGTQPAFPTEEGKKWGLRKSWTAPLSLAVENVDIVLGKDENGLASAWVKKFSEVKGTGFVQIWLDATGADDLSYILRVAEYGFTEQLFADY